MSETLRKFRYFVELETFMNLIVIPARLQSTRLPRKLLLNETGQSLIEHTYRAAQTASIADAVLVAADSQEIITEVERFGGTAVLTDINHVSGTDRIAEVARAKTEYEIFVNVQGDEPELPGAAIDLAISMLQENPAAPVATLATPIRDREELNDPNCVKVVFNQSGEALYFSRSPIPHARTWHDDLLLADPPNFFQHIGLYAYRRDFLLQLATLKPSPLEQLESLEQLRVLHAGAAIQIGIIDHPVRGIDTAADYAAFVSRHAKR